MALRWLNQRNHNANFIDFGADPAGGDQALPMDNRRIQLLANIAGTLPRGRKQVRGCFYVLGGWWLLPDWKAAFCRCQQKHPSFPKWLHRFTVASGVRVLEGSPPEAFSLAGLGIAIKSFQHWRCGKLWRGASKEVVCPQGLVRMKCFCSWDLPWLYSFSVYNSTMSQNRLLLSRSSFKLHLLQYSSLAGLLFVLQCWQKAPELFPSGFWSILLQLLDWLGCLWHLGFSPRTVYFCCLQLEFHKTHYYCKLPGEQFHLWSICLAWRNLNRKCLRHIVIWKYY